MDYNYNGFPRPQEEDGSFTIQPADEPAARWTFQQNIPDPILPNPHKRKRTWPKAAALVLACALVGGGAGVGGALLTRQTAASPAPSGGSGVTTVFEGSGSPAVVNLSKIDGGQLLTAAEVYASNVNSTVGIITQVTTNVWGQQVAQAASGSGFVLTSDGYIITNHHVVEDATSIEVEFHDGSKYTAKLVGAEAENDLAVLKIDASGLTPVRLGSSSDLVVGENVVAIGNPLGELTFTMTGGMISALDRRITMSDGTAINTLQTDCAINSGNSGGPLFNMYGQVIGITNAKYSNNGDSSSASIEGIGFAIPIDDVKGMIVDIMEHGYVTGKPYVGFTLATANANNAARYGRSGGAFVQSLVPGAAADKAGLQQGDIITAVDGQTIEGHADFIEIKDQHKAGDTVHLTVDRAGQKIELDLTFDEKRPDDQVGAAQGGYVEPFTDEWENGGSDDRYSDDYNYRSPYSGDIWDYFRRFGW